MPLSWNEIRHRAIAFANEWKGETREAAERQTFWNEFFNVFGMRRRAVASFEEPVRKLSGSWGAIDLFWPGKLLVEHKSAGEDLGKAHSQAMAYIRGLQDSGRGKEQPRWVVVTDFRRFALHDLEPEEGEEGQPRKRTRPSIEFGLSELHKHIKHFAFIAGYTQHRLDPEDPANIEATQLMCDLHDALESGGYRGHELKRFLVRLLFCFFAEDTGIFPQKSFELFIRDRTASDGSDMGARLEQLFRVLNTDTPQRQANLDEDLKQFPYVNGELFAERLDFADFNSDMRNGLLACCRFRWDTISPAVFGSLFQSVMDSKERRKIGAHYTAEQNILKLIRSLFLDDLRAEFDKLSALNVGKKQRLADFQSKLAGLKFLDPACGCGNFLVLTYRELRKLELEVLLGIHGKQAELTLDDANKLSKLNVDQFYGIEIEEFPARIAEVALWLADHQANIALSNAFSQLVVRLPLRSSPHITVANALRTDWATVLPPRDCSFVLGNPPFVGKQYMSAEQKADMEAVCGKVSGSGVLDLVTGWYFKAASYIGGTSVRCAFVSTNSISQGEQPGVLWKDLFSKHRLKIHFAHRTFPWESEARGRAHVHVVIIGFGALDVPSKRITDYDSDLDHPTQTTVANINPYLVEGSDRCMEKRRDPLCPSDPMVYGSKPVDGGHLILSEEEKDQLIAECPEAATFIRRFLGSVEFINGLDRWCLWLADVPPAQWRHLTPIRDRVERVKEFRLASKKAKTVELASQPFVFGELRQPKSNYLAVPEVSSQSRRYIPIGYVHGDIIASNLLYTVPNASMYGFGFLTSQMHMAWVRYVCGRLKSDYRYSAGLVYNNFPWPQGETAAQRKAVAKAAQEVLDARANNVPATLADLYDPLSMPADLSKAHAALDREVDLCYRKEPFGSDRERVEYLFAQYEKITSPLLLAPKARRRKRIDS
jgi:restriction-modification enzyme MmeI-like protein